MAEVKYKNSDGAASNISVDSTNRLIFNDGTSDHVVMHIFVGMILITSDGTSPATYYGGTWTPITNKFLYAVGSDYGKDGGSDKLQKHTHTFSGSTSQMSENSTGTWHNTTENQLWFEPTGCVTRKHLGGDGVDGNKGWFDKMTINVQHTHSYSGTTASTGSGDSENMPPYVKVAAWKCTAI